MKSMMLSCVQGASVPRIMHLGWQHAVVLVAANQMISVQVCGMCLTICNKRHAWIKGIWSRCLQRQHHVKLHQMVRCALQPQDTRDVCPCIDQLLGRETFRPGPSPGAIIGSATIPSRWWILGPVARIMNAMDEIISEMNTQRRAGL